MDMNIEKFNAQLTSAKKDESQLLTSLRQLTTLENPKDIIDATADAAPLWWEGWS